MQMHRQVDGANLRQYPWGYPEAGETTDKNRRARQLPVLRDAPHPAVPLPLHLRQALDRDRPADPPPARPDPPGRPDDHPASSTRTTSATSLLVAPVIAPKADGRDTLPPGRGLGRLLDRRAARRQAGHHLEKPRHARPASLEDPRVRASSARSSRSSWATTSRRSATPTT